MPICFISIGSNINPVHNILSALEALQYKFGSLTYSSVYESAPIGFSGDAFLNLVTSFYSDHNPVHIALQLKNIEAEHNRVRTEEKFSARILDLDLLLYDQEIIATEALTIPHKDILDYAFVLEPLAEIAPDRHHPIKDVCFEKLWQEFDKSKAVQQKVNYLVEAVASAAQC